MSHAGTFTHGAMLSDAGRNDVLARAIELAVRPGDVVVDVGAGIGLLSLLAARAGAARVYALEHGPLARVAQEAVDRNGFSDVVVIERCSSLDWAPPEPADLVVSETLGFAVLDEQFRLTMADAVRRLLKPSGTAIPQQVKILAAPVERVDWPIDPDYLQGLHGFSFGEVADLFRTTHQRGYVPPERQLGPEALVAELDSRALDLTQAVGGELELAIDRSGAVGGLAVWFEAGLGNGLTLSSRSHARTNHWGQTLLPISPPVEVECGGSLRVALELDDRLRFGLSWRVLGAGEPARLEMQLR